MNSKKEEKKSKKVILKLFIVIILTAIISFVLRIAPNYIKEQTDNIKLVINYTDVTNYLKSDVYKDENGTIYLSKEDISNFYDEFIYYDETYNQIITTANDKILVMKIDSGIKEINGKQLAMNDKIFKRDNTFYIPFSELKDIYNVQATYVEESNTFILDSIDKELNEGKTSQDINIKYKSTFFSKTIEKITEGENLAIVPLTDEQNKLISNDWVKVRTKKRKFRLCSKKIYYK